MITLDIAQQVGLEIPATLVTNTKKTLIEFKEKYKEIITKNIQDTTKFTVKTNLGISTFVFYTSEVNNKIINELPDKFATTKFQEKIDKFYELRIFYLDKKTITMAIFSQNDAQTEVDFRRYNQEKPNRTVPYSLPEEISAKIEKLMTAFGLNTGSIDMIYTNDNRYIFLEINPVGQFGMVSYPCNYYLEKKVAEFLTQ